jgi:predicted DNA-binding transcriptional regulator AlpA
MADCDSKEVRTRLDDGHERQIGEAERAQAPMRLTYRLDEVAAALGVSRRTIEREWSAGRFPKPDLMIGKAPLWSPETLTRWVSAGGSRR